MTNTTRSTPSSGSLVVYVYPTISPKVVVIPIVSCIIVFPILVLIIICALRYRAIRARQFDKRSRGRLELNAADHVSGSSGCHSRFNNGRPVIQFKNGKRKTIVRFKPMPELDLDTVVEERSEFDAEVSDTELQITPNDPNRLCVINHPISFRSFRFGYGASGHPIPKTDSKISTIGSPVSKRANDTEELSTLLSTSNAPSCSTNEKLGSSSLSSPVPSCSSLGLTTTSQAGVLDGGIQIHTTVDKYESNVEGTLCDKNKNEVDNVNIIDVVPASSCSFVIPSFCIEQYPDDENSEESISFIDKSEEVQFISECDSPLKITKVRFEVRPTKLSDDIKKDSGRIVHNKDESEELINTTDQINSGKPNAPTCSGSLDNVSCQEAKRKVVACRNPERNYKPTQLDFTLDNRELLCNRKSDSSSINLLRNEVCDDNEFRSNENNTKETSIEMDTLVYTCDYQNEYYDSDEV